jgi:hypothetical protein
MTNADSSSGNVVFLRNFYDGQPFGYEYSCHADPCDSPSPPAMQPYQFVKAVC